MLIKLIETPKLTPLTTHTLSPCTVVVSNAHTSVSPLATIDTNAHVRMRKDIPLQKYLPRSTELTCF